ncbi:Hypothetical predicted protein [Olea europaea subsp. europaea]|uniref:Transmembrane protein n=2 Tax=Olea europaea subsp. europaea TaxID=158383 RepID=A0A8S0V458_OLEEU|nr:Hypothetical predicted protein [Olea europaea subsp. europaea]
MEEEKSVQFSFEPIHPAEENGHGWQKVTYAKKIRKNKTTSDSSRIESPGSSAVPEKNNVFKNLEKNAEARRRALEVQRAAAAIFDEDDAPVRSKKRWGDEDDDGDDEDGNLKENVSVETNKKEKPKKVKKPKVTVAEAAAKIDAADLDSFLSNVLVSYEGQQDIQLMRFADYFGRAFAAVNSSQFPWLKLFRESTVEKIAEVPVSYISEAVYKTSVDWINHCSFEALNSFVLWSLDGIFADLTAQQLGSKGSKKGGQPTSSRSQVAIFLVLAMVLRRKPDVLINILPNLRENKYQGQDKLPVIVWMVVQASRGDLAVGLYLWAHHILPMLKGKLSSNPQSRDLVLQVVERILSAPKARSILVNGSVRKGERLIPPASLDQLLHVTFPASSARVKATERFESIYPTLKEVALAGAPGSKAMKQVSQQIQAVAVKSAQEEIPELTEEAVSIFVWCLTQNPDCYKQWDKIYMDNIEVSVAALRKLAKECKEIPLQQCSLEALRQTLNIFRQKNEKALAGGVDVAHQAFFKDADKYCKVILGKISRGHSCAKTVAFAFVVLAVGAAIISPNLGEWDWDKFSALFNAQ